MYFGLGYMFFFAGQSLAFYFLRGTVLDFLLQDHGYKNKKKFIK